LDMPRTNRVAPGGMIFHLLNPGNARDPIHPEDADCDVFEKVVAQTMKQVTMRVLVYCLTAKGLGRASQRGAEPQGPGGNTGFRDSRASIWRRGLAKSDCHAPGSGVHFSPPRPAEEGAEDTRR
jgi:hypothetical protein